METTFKKIAAALFLILSVGASADEATRVVLPNDDAPHSAREDNSEWWYYNGHLTTASGHRYGYELVFFQAKHNEVLFGRIAQFAITDVDGNSFHYKTWMTLGKYDSTPGAFHVEIPKGPEAFGVNGNDHIHAPLPDGTVLDLDLTSLKEPVVEFGNGYLNYLDPRSQHSFGHDHYYSRTRLKTQGTLTKNGTAETVEGISWFDHEWGLLPNLSWEWYSIQLDNGEEYMAYNLRKLKGSTSILRGGTFIAGNGNSIALSDKEFEMSSSGAWQSPHTGRVYPTEFQMNIPSQQVELHLEPLVQDQEVRTFPLPTYWEGAVSVSGTENGKPVKGVGYVELKSF